MTDQQQAEGPEFARALPAHDPHFRTTATVKQRLSSFTSRMFRRWREHRVIPPVTSPDGKHVWPVTLAWGVRGPLWVLGYHTGEDHSCPPGNAARATTYGKVIFAGDATNDSGWGADYGIQVVMQTADGKYDYAHNHLRSVRVKVGDSIHPGMLVGITGQTGHVTGPHSHFEARPAGGGVGSDVNPMLVKKKAH